MASSLAICKRDAEGEKTERKIS